MPHDYLPEADGAFDAFLTNLVEAATAFWAAQGLDAKMLTALTVAAEQWRLDYAAAVAARAAAEGATAQKRVSRAAAEAAARPLVAFVQALPETTDADRASMGITVKSTARRAVPAPTTAPLVSAAPVARLTHALRLSDETTPTRARKPRGAQRCELFVALTDPAAPAPTNIDDYRYVASATDATFTMTFPATAGGRQAHYLARWAGPTGGLGPWSAAASATVAA